MMVLIVRTFEYLHLTFIAIETIHKHRFEKIGQNNTLTDGDALSMMMMMMMIIS